jgi:hypothetical protein
MPPKTPDEALAKDTANRSLIVAILTFFNTEQMQTFDAFSHSMPAVKMLQEGRSLRSLKYMVYRLRDNNLLFRQGVRGPGVSYRTTDSGRKLLELIS